MLAVLGLETPVVDDAAQPVLDHEVVGVNQGVHVRVEALRCIDGVVVETDLDVVLRIGAYYEVDVRPVGQKITLDVADDLRQVLLVRLPQRLVVLRRLEFAVEHLAVVNPFGAEHLEGIGLIRVVFGQESDADAVVWLE